MLHLPRNKLLASTGRHLASEPHVRLQVLPVKPAGPGELFAGYHGELLVIALEGACTVRTKDDSVRLEQNDQVLLLGEPFRIERDPEAEATVQLVWMPGPNPCRFCWEQSGRFYST